MLARFLRFVFVALAVSASIFAPATAHEYELGGLEIVHPWARASAGSAKNGAVYLDIINRGTTDDRLVAASSPMAARIELHKHASQNGIMKMEPVEAFELAAGDHVTLQPGGFHIMLMGLIAPLVEGRSFPLTLEFETAGRVDVSVTIASVATMHSTHGANQSGQ